MAVFFPLHPISNIRICCKQLYNFNMLHSYDWCWQTLLSILILMKNTSRLRSMGLSYSQKKMRTILIYCFLYIVFLQLLIFWFFQSNWNDLKNFYNTSPSNCSQIQRHKNTKYKQYVYTKDNKSTWFIINVCFCTEFQSFLLIQKLHFMNSIYHQYSTTETVHPPGYSGQVIQLNGGASRQVGEDKRISECQLLTPLHDSVIPVLSAESKIVD